MSSFFILLSITIQPLLNDISSKPIITAKITLKIKKLFRYAKPDCSHPPFNLEKHCFVL